MPDTITVCAHCGVPLTRDDTLSWWMREDCWYDDNVLDVDNSGRSCPADADNDHTPVTVSA